MLMLDYIILQDTFDTIEVSNDTNKEKLAIYLLFQRGKLPCETVVRIAPHTTQRIDTFNLTHLPEGLIYRNPTFLELVDLGVITEVTDPTTRM